MIEPAGRSYHLKCQSPTVCLSGVLTVPAQASGDATSGAIRRRGLLTLCMPDE